MIHLMMAKLLRNASVNAWVLASSAVSGSAGGGTAGAGAGVVAGEDVSVGRGSRESLMRC
jgi:hypothetical protein